MQVNKRIDRISNQTLKKYYLKFSLLRYSIMFILLLFSGSVTAQFWPKEITGSRYKIIIYQPQLDSLNGYILTGISAFSVTPKGKKSPIFGALFFEGKIDVDRDNRLYTLVSLKISNIKFSAEENDVNLDSVKYAIQNDVVNWDSPYLWMNSSLPLKFQRIIPTKGVSNLTMTLLKLSLQLNPPYLLSLMENL